MKCFCTLRRDCQGACPRLRAHREIQPAKFACDLRLRRPAICTSEARARRCSIGCLRAAGRHDDPAHRGHGRRTQSPGTGRRNSRRSAMARRRLGRRPLLSVAAPGFASRRGAEKLAASARRIFAIARRKNMRAATRSRKPRTRRKSRARGASLAARAAKASPD